MLQFACLVFQFVCVFFSSRHISPIEDINATAIKNMILRYVSKNKKYAYAPLNENEGQICLKPVKTMTCSRFEEVHLQCTALWPVRIGIIRIQCFVFQKQEQVKYKMYNKEYFSYYSLLWNQFQQSYHPHIGSMSKRYGQTFHSLLDFFSNSPNKNT